MTKSSLIFAACLFLLVPCYCQELVQVGLSADGGHVVSTRQVIRPAGESLEFGGRPVDLVLSGDGKTLYVKDNHGLVVVDTSAWEIRQELRFGDKTGGSMHGITVTRDGYRVYATTANQ